MNSIKEILYNLEDHARQATVTLQEALSRTAHLWDLDPLFEIVAICLERYGRILCGSTVYFELEPAPYKGFQAALREAEEIGFNIETVVGPRIHFKWEPLEEARSSARQLAHALASTLKQPITVGVNILGVSNERGHLGFYIEIGTCVPASWSFQALVVRYTELLSYLGRNGIDFSKRPPSSCLCNSPMNIFRDEIRCVHVVVSYHELEPPKPKVVEKGESASIYIQLMDEDLEKYYPVDLEGETQVELHVILPHYEPPWPTPTVAKRIVEEMGGEVVLSYGDREEGGVIARIRRSLVQIEWGTKLTRCRVKLLDGDREVLLSVAKELARTWAEKELGVKEGDAYLEAIEKAKSLNDLMNAALEYEDEY